MKCEPAPAVFRDHLRALDGLRGAAVLMVLWAHSKPLLGAVERALGAGFTLGYLGVETFFVLSGFLITRILLSDRGRGVPLRYFLARRALRIFPIYYLVVGAAWVAWGDPLAPWAAVYASNYRAALHPAGETMLTHTWSLAVEEHFYLLWPLVVWGLPREGARRVATWVFPAVGVASAVVVAATVAEPMRAIGLIYTGSLSRMLSLGLGAALAFHEGPLRAMGRRGVMVAAGVGLAGLVAGPVVARLLPRFVGTPQAAQVVKLVAFPMVAGAVLVLTVRATAGGGVRAGAGRAWRAALEAGWLRFVGRISYGLYLYHFPIFLKLGCEAPGAEAGVPVWKNLAAIGLTFAVAAASYALIEAPILRLKKRFAGTRTEAEREEEAVEGVAVVG